MHAYLFFQGMSPEPKLDRNIPLLGLVKLDLDGSTLNPLSLKARVEDDMDVDKKVVLVTFGERWDIKFRTSTNRKE